MIEYLSYKQAINIVHTLGIKNRREWSKNYSTYDNLKNIPKCPDVVYKDKGWISWGEWLDTHFITQSKRKYLSYEQVREKVIGLKFKNQVEWFQYIKQNPIGGVPTHPNTVYKDKGWISWTHFLGHNERTTDRNCLSYEESKIYVQSLGLKNQCSWNIYKKNNGISNIPSRPDIIYKNSGWVSWGEWLGNNNINPVKQHNSYLSYNESYQIVNKLGLKNIIEWRKYQGEHNLKSIPYMPDVYYKDKGWISWKVWLNAPIRECKRKDKTNYMSYEEAEKFVQENHIVDVNDFYKYFGDCQNSRIPHNPVYIYKEHGWKGWNVFLGYEPVRTALQFVSYNEAKEYVKKFKICNSIEWEEFTKLKDFPLFIPKYPFDYYRNIGWVSWSDFLGCSMYISSGESLIYKYLENLNKKFKFQYRFDVSGMRERPYDFAVFQKNKVYVIEFNGRQHYDIVYIGKHNISEKVNERDKIKQDFCENNNVPLLVIPYTQMNNIHELIDEFLEVKP